MHITIVHVRVKSDHIRDFLEATRLNHEASIKEPGNRRFDVMQSPEDPGYFVLYEAYADAASARAHKDTSHYATWRDRVAPWMAEPRRGESFTGLYPA